MNKQWKVYIHTNKINGKKYVGITNKEYATERWGKNGVGYIKNTHFINSINKYGWDNFEHNVFLKDLSEEQAIRIEKMLISELDLTNYNKGYNNHDGGTLGKKPHEILLLSICKSKKYIEKYESVKECLMKHGFKGGSYTLYDVAKKRNMMAIKSKGIDDIARSMIENNIKSSIVYFNKIGELSQLKENELTQVAEIRVFKDGNVRIKGKGFSNGCTYKCLKSSIDKVKLKDDFTIL